MTEIAPNPSSPPLVLRNYLSSAELSASQRYSDYQTTLEKMRDYTLNRTEHSNNELEIKIRIHVAIHEN